MSGLSPASIFVAVLAVLGLAAQARAAGDPTPPPAVSSSAAVPPASGDSALREQVRALVRQAGERIERGDARSAAMILEEARRLRPDPTLDYNLGVTYAELGQGPESAQALLRFLQGADASRVLPERIADARKRVSDYERSLARLRVRVTLPPGSFDAALYVDERPSSVPLPGGRLPEPMWLKPGVHRLLVVAKGLRDYRVAFDLAAGEKREVTGDLYEDETALGLLRDPGTIKMSKEPQPLYKKWWFWTAVGGGTATAVALIAAAASGAFNHIAPGSDLDAVDLAK
jgi:hypothetical protein